MSGRRSRTTNRRRIVLTLAVLVIITGAGWSTVSAARVWQAEKEYVAYVESPSSSCANGRLAARKGNLRFFDTWLAAMRGSSFCLSIDILDYPTAYTAVACKRDSGEWITELRKIDGN